MTKGPNNSSRQRSPDNAPGATSAGKGVAKRGEAPTSLTSSSNSEHAVSDSAAAGMRALVRLLARQAAADLLAQSHDKKEP